MYKKAGPCEAKITAISIVEGAFRYVPGTDPEPSAELVVMYSHAESGVSYGTCPMRSSLFSAKTKELFIQFLQSAEEDFGEEIFGERLHAESETLETPVFPTGTRDAESATGMKYLGGVTEPRRI